MSKNINTNTNIICFDLDVDEMFDIYSYFKKNKLVNGIPAIFAYKKGNESFVPDYSVSGANISNIDKFFNNII